MKVRDIWAPGFQHLMRTFSGLWGLFVPYGGLSVPYGSLLAPYGVLRRLMGGLAAPNAGLRPGVNLCDSLTHSHTRNKKSHC